MMNRARLLFSFSGRIKRADYWRAGLLYVLILIVLMVAMMIYVSIARQYLAAARGSPILPALGVGLAAAFFVSTLAISTKRLHDRNKSAWWLIPFNVAPFGTAAIGELAADDSLRLAAAAISVALSLWGLVEFGILNGSAGANTYGPDPRAA